MSIKNLACWRPLFVLLSGIFISVVATVPVTASTPLTVPATMSSYDEIEDYVQNEIRSNIGSAMCGGWDASQSVATTIPVVTGAPGRHALDDDPLNAVELGMSIKEDAFYFPAEPSTCGFTSACLPANGTSSRFRPTWFANNSWQQACERPLEGYREDESGLTPPKNGADVHYSCGGGDADFESGHDFCPNVFANNPSLANPDAGLVRKPGDGTNLNDNTAGGICQRLNEDWIFTLWKQPVKEIDPDTGDEEIVGYNYQKGGCTDYTDDATLDAPPAEDAEWEKDSTRYCCSEEPLGSAYKNCVACTGGECRSGVQSPGLGRDEWYATVDEDAYAKYTRARYFQSFFREYTVDAVRNKVATGKNDDEPGTPLVEPTKLSDESKFDDSTRRGIAVSCYGPWYWAYGAMDPGNFINPEFVHVPRKYFRCVIGTFFKKIDGSDEKQMDFTQAGKGTYLAKHWDTKEKYLDPPVDDPKRTNATATNPKNTTWMRDLARGFSLIWKEVFVKQENYDLTNSLMTPDITVQRSTVQRYVPDRDALVTKLGTSDALKAIKEIQLSQGALVRAFDDTVAGSNQKRSLVEWWQKLSLQMNAYFTMPKVQLLLPPGWALDLNPEHPFLNPRLPDPSKFRKNPEYQPIEVQLQVREDLLGEVASYLESSILLRYKPEPITVLVPSGSASEFRTLANDWCLWYIESSGSKSCDTASGPVGDLITQLQTYADRIDESRKLRAESSAITAKYLSFQTEVQTLVGKWVLDNTDQFLAWHTAWQDRLSLQPIWQETVAEAWKFTETTNQPWCMNQRFTLPIYTLLNRANMLVDPNATDATTGLNLRALGGETLPIIDGIYTQTGITFDMSSIVVGTGTVYIPVLQPLEIKLDMAGLTAPGLEVKNSPVPKLPDLPAIPDFSSALDTFTPFVFKPKNLPKSFKDVFTLDTYTGVADVLLAAKIVYEDLNKEYNIFWNSVDRDPKEPEIKDAELDCITPFSKRCVHSEFDILERITRMFSRPNVYLKEDFESLGEFRSTDPQSCLDEKFATYKDWVCEQLAPHKTYPSQGYAIGGNNPQSSSAGSTGGASNDALEKINKLRVKNWLDAVLQEGVPEADKLKYTVPRNAITPSFRQPPAIKIHSTGSTTPTP